MNGFIAPAAEHTIAKNGKAIPQVPPVHAAYVNRRPASAQVWFSSKWTGTWRSLCGRRIHAIIPGPWDEDRVGACEKCAEAVRVLEYNGEEPDMTVRNYVG